MELEEAVMNKPERALAFILAYLKYRGPFFTWIMRNGEDGMATGRCDRPSQLPSMELFLSAHPPIPVQVGAVVGVGNQADVNRRDLERLLNHECNYLTCPYVWFAGRAFCSLKCLSTHAQFMLTHLPDLDFSAAIHIGRHLNYLLTVSHGHNVHYLKGIVAKVWGPLYLHVELERVTYPMKRLTEREKVHLATEVFARMLETVTWNSLNPFEGVRRNIAQDRQSRLIRYDNVTSQYVQDQLKEPKFGGTNIGDLMHNAAIQQAIKKDQMRAQEPCSSQWKTSEPFMKPQEVCQDVQGYCQAEKTAAQPCRAQAKPTVPFPPDRCQIAHGMHYQKERRP
ncbi:hypothetical protein SprV_0902756900 [Sparganum proliferum]